MDITPWIDFGWPIALLVLVLGAIGTGLGLFLRAYLKQQADEFAARRKEQDRKDALLMEQHEFIRELASNSIKESSAALQQMAEVRGFMQEMTRGLALVNEQLHEHNNNSGNSLKGLGTQNQQIYDHVTQLERTMLTQKRSIGD